jgi:hypothetical protein
VTALVLCHLCNPCLQLHATAAYFRLLQLFKLARRQMQDVEPLSCLLQLLTCK